MKVKAKGILWAVVLSLCCMGCGAQETPVPPPVEESVSSVAEISREEVRNEPDSAQEESPLKMRALYKKRRKSDG